MASKKSRKSRNVNSATEDASSSSSVTTAPTRAATPMLPLDEKRSRLDSASFLSHTLPVEERYTKNGHRGDDSHPMMPAVFQARNSHCHGTYCQERSPSPLRTQELLHVIESALDLLSEDDVDMF